MPRIRSHPTVEKRAGPRPETDERSGRPPDAGADDAALVAAARAEAGGVAFRLLYERYVRQVYRYCYLRLGSREAAEDATHEVFLKVHTGLAGYHGGLFRAWLFTIAANVVVDAQRRNRGRRPPLPLDAAADVSDPRDVPDEVALARSEGDTLRAALRSLPSDQRAMVELQLADLSTREIANVLGRSQNAIRLLRFRAHQQLRSILADDGHGAVTDTGAPR